MPSPWGIFGGGSTGDKVSVSSADTTPDFLFSKLSAGPGVSLAIIGSGNQQVQISATGVGSTPNEQEFTAVADQTIFALSGTPAVPSATIIWVNGFKYIYNVHYTVVGNTLTWLNVDFTLITGDKVSAYFTT